MSEQAVGAQFSRVLLVTGLGRIGTTGLGLVSTILLVRGLSPEAFAQYATAFAAISLLSLLSLFGAETTILRDTAAAIARGDDRRARIAATGDIIGVAILSPAIGGLALAIALPLLEAPAILLPCAIWVIAMSLNRVLGEWLRGLRLVLPATLFNGSGPFGGLFNSAATLGALLILTATGQMTLPNILWASVGITMLSASIALLIGMSVLGLSPGREALAHRRATIRSTMPLYGMQGLHFLTNAQGHILLAGFIFDARAIALLAVALRLHALASTVLVTLTQAGSELIVRLHALSDRKGLERILRLSASCATAAAIAIAAALAVLRPQGFELIFGVEYGPAYGLALLFMLVAILNAVGGLSIRTLTLLGHADSALRVQILGALATLGLALPMGIALGPPGFVAGCALATLIQRLVAVRMVRRHIGITAHAYLAPRDYLGLARGLILKRRAA
ncbi:lipopolysaccharide biosynthesis protein [Pelagibacterium lacus]|uniref:Polysaccharide biosynthesis protein n=1 Tax=Pelagibacterium lacus TaxID=2282655 RepID=A0A369W495_9HYPH|nr:oligosaccharide flippase family protein [Pelagibacterium lacus]RDE09143.1 hypothetical protein DVH29_08105 [Pelagibacterium lacus]